MIEILQVRGEAYSSWSEKNVNDSHHTIRARLQNLPDGKVLTAKRIAGTARWHSVGRSAGCGKAEDGRG